MSKLSIYRGVPGSGKSTEAMKYVEAGNALRLNRDDIRFSKFGKYWGMDENLVTKFFEADLHTALATGLDVISDNTNLVKKYVVRQIDIAQQFGYEVEFHDFPISRNEAIERDAAREKQVGEQVINTFFRRFIGKDGLSLPPAPTFEQVTFQPYVKVGDGAPRAILVDIDGTLAHHEGIRGPYDTSRYHLDMFDNVVAEIVETYSGWNQGKNFADVIVMSGRDSAYRGVTEAWLKKWGFRYDALYMRPEGDKRNDAIVKNELFEQHIAGKYDVEFVLDDRNRVVNMWRAKGLKVLQVADGDF